MEFQHFLITRFNLRNLSFDANKDRDVWISWTENRMPLFLNYCLPSVLNQSNQNFTWLIFVDKSTPEHLLQKLVHSSQNSNIKWCLMEPCQDFGQEMLTWVEREIENGTKWIITTNLDNDDVIHNDALENIQSHFVPIQDHLIFLSNGYTFNPDSRRLSHYYYPQSPFYSLIEKTDEKIKGLFFRTHSHWMNCKLKFMQELRSRLIHQRNRRATYILDGPMWAQIIHGNNATNNFYRGFPVLRKKDMGDFGIDTFSNKMKLKLLGKYFNYVYWKRYLYCSILKWLD